MKTRRHDISILTGTGGTATEFTEPVSGMILSLHYLQATASAIPATGELALGSEVTEQTIWGETATGTMHRAPRQPTHSAAGAAATSAYEYFFVANERLKVTVAGGGSGKRGVIRVITTDS